MKLNSYQERYLINAINDLISHRVSLHLVAKKDVKVEPSDTDGSGGYFDESSRLLSVATQDKSWFEIFIHEYQHYKQFLTGRWFTEESGIHFSSFWSWLDKEAEFSEKEISKFISTIQKIELNCEQRVIKEVNKQNQLIDRPIKQYIQAANIYLFSYVLMKEKRKWPKKFPFKIKSVLKETPDYFLKDYSVIPEKLYKQLKRYTKF